MLWYCCCSLLMFRKRAAVPKSSCTHDKKWKVNNRFGDPEWTKTSLFDYGSKSTIRAEQSSFPSLTNRTMMALSLKWDEVPQAASCGDFLAMWWSGHTLPCTHRYHCLLDGLWWTYIPLQPGWQTQLPCCQMSKREHTRLDVWCVWVMDTFTGWQRQPRISHSCLHLQATRKLLLFQTLTLTVCDW